MSGNLGGTFDAKEEKSGGVLPAGNYRLLVTQCKIIKGSTGNYEQIVVECKILDGEFQNKELTFFLNFKWVGSGNPTDNQKKAIAIGKRQFAAICVATGKPSVNDTSEIVGGRFLGELKVNDKSDEYEPRNELKKAKPLPSGSTPTAAPGGVAGNWNA